MILEFDKDAVMAEIVLQFPQIGRRDLAKKAGVTEYIARTFLENRSATRYTTVVNPDKRAKLVDAIINSKLSDKELEVILESTRIATPVLPKLKPKSTGSFKALIFSDSHIGHKCFLEHQCMDMLDNAVKQGCDWAWHPGDILEGMSGRPGHVYELDAIGFEAQFEKAVRFFEQFPFPIRGITGNHDLWYAGKADQGVNIGERLQSALPDTFFFLGNEEADELVNGIKVKLWHGRDGGSYALSYRGQKFIEQLSGGDKPHILITGHDHKSLFFQCRNVLVIGAGTTCSQTGFMRGKKLAAHTGYWIIEVFTNENGLESITPTWYPFYI